MLAEPCRVSDIFHSLAKRHDVDTETLARDVTPFLQTLVEATAGTGNSLRVNTR